MTSLFISDIYKHIHKWDDENNTDINVETIRDICLLSLNDLNTKNITLNSIDKNSD